MICYQLCGLQMLEIMYENQENLLKKYCGIKGNAVFIIKIPKYYLTPRISSNGQLMQIPLPIWRTVIDKYRNEISHLSPELVYGVYISDNDSLLFNSNYSKVHDPNGLKFDNQQIDYLAINGLVSWNDFAASRRSKSYEELKRYDFDNNTWSETIQQYKNHFGINQLKNR